MNRPLYDIQRHLHLQARRRPARPFDRLMRFVTDWAVIREAWRRVRTSQGADTPGADRLSARDLPSESSATRAFLQNLADQLQSGTYQPGAVRRFSIPKPNHPGETRPLAILTLADRVAHMAIKLVLEPIVEARLGKRCFGFRPGRNRYDQIQSIRRLMLAHPDEFGAALCADIASCFDFLDHELILEDVRAVTTDSEFDSLFRRVLEQVCSGQAGWWRRRRVGVLQGSPLSPLIANWTLARFDRAWQRDHAERAPLFRYADDLVVLARGPSEAARLRRPLDRCLRQANKLELSPQKTRTATLDRGIPLLGLLLRRHEDLFAERDDVRIFIDPKIFREVLTEIDDWIEQLDPGRPLGKQFARFNQRLRGWFETYQYAYDAAQAFDSLDRHLFVALRHRLKDLTACSAAALDQEHHLRLPSGHDTWHAGGVCLLSLSALPRKCYRPRNARPPWEADLDPDKNPARILDPDAAPPQSLPGDPQPDPVAAGILVHEGTDRGEAPSHAREDSVDDPRFSAGELPPVHPAQPDDSGMSSPRSAAEFDGVTTVPRS